MNGYTTEVRFSFLHSNINRSGCCGSNYSCQEFKRSKAMSCLEDLSETDISTQRSPMVEMRRHQSADIKGRDEGKL